jgi:hypothetical protein
MRWIGVGIAVLGVAACSDNEAPGEGDRTIEVVGSAQFSGTSLDTVGEILTVRVTDQNARPLAGIPLTWSTASGGSMVPQTPSTTADGTARARWILGWQAGAQQASATVDQAVTPAVFGATAEGFQARSLSTGDGEHQCGIDTGGALFCWGPNDDGQLGNGATTSSETPVPALVTGPISQVVTGFTSSGGDFTCALTSTGEVYCWGANDRGQLGDGTTDASLTPAPVLLPPVGFRSLASKGGGACAISTGGEGYCWGENIFGRLGIGSTSAHVVTPTPIAGGLRWHHLALGDDRSCGVDQGRQVYCWGGQPAWLGTGVDTSTVAPLAVQSAPSMDSLTLSGWHQCGITSTNATYCWGANHNLGVVDPREVVPEPLELPAPPAFRSIQSIFKPTFGLGVDGVGYWWGPPPGATGGGPETPVPFSGDIRLSAMGTNGSGVCGTEASTGTVYCWSLFSWGGPEKLTALAKP